MKKIYLGVFVFILFITFQKDIIAGESICVHVSGHCGDNIQSAINSLENGGTVILEEGEYIIYESLLLKNDISIVGKGKQKTILMLADSANCHIITHKNYVRGNKNIAIKGLTLDGNRLYQNRDGVCRKLAICGAYFLNSKQIFISHVEANNIYESGIHFTTCSNVVMENIYSENVGMSGIGCCGTNNVVIVSSVVNNSGLDEMHSAIHIDSGENIFIEAEVNKCTGNGIMVSSGFAEIRNVYVKGKCKKCLRGVALLGSMVKKPLSCAYVTGAFSDSQVGILISNSDRITARNCILKNNEFGIFLQGKNQINNDLIFDNIFKDNDCDHYTKTACTK